MATLIAWSPPAEARDGAVSISSRTLPDALAELSREEGISIGAEGALPRVRTPRIARAASIADALVRLLAGTGFRARQVGPSAWRIERAVTAPASENSETATLPPPELVTVPIVVTATKRRQALSDTPAAISVARLNAADDEDVRRDSTWAAAQVEGVALAGEGPGRNRMFLRGVADSPFNGDSQSTVAVLLDDTRLTYSAPDPDIKLVDVDRVEVLKGPQGTLYGTGALGGIYRVVTRRADPSQAAFAFSASGELLAWGQPGGAASAMANIPITNEAAARVVAYGERSPGWVDTGDRSASNASTVIGVRANLGIEPANGWRIDATGFGQWLNSSDSSYVYAPGSRSRPAQSAEPHDNDLRHLALRAEREGAIRVVFSSGVTWHEVRDRYDATQGANGFGLADPSLLDDTRDYRTWDSELRLTGAFGPIDWLAGLSHVEARQETQSLLQSPTGSALSLQADKRIVSDSAAFGEAVLALSSKLDLVAGGRLFRTHFQDDRQQDVSSFTASQTKTGATPAAALSWQPRRGRLLYLRYGSAFRQGGSSVAPNGQLQSLEGDELGTLEAGWRETFGNATLDLGAYFSRWESVQSDMLGPNGLLTTRNAGDARIWGAEVSFSGTPAAGWLLNAGATWQSALLVRNETGIALDDRRLPSIPQYTLRAAASRTWTTGSNEVRLGASLRYVGPARFSFQPELDVPMGDYLETVLEGQVRLDRVTFGLKFENPLGVKADSFPFGNPLRASLIRQFTPQRPASVSLQVRFSG